LFVVIVAFSNLHHQMRAGDPLWLLACPISIR
jgi:hypothetical protein